MKKVSMNRPCPRCEQEILTAEKIAALAAEIKIEPSLAAEKPVYEKRLASCRGCEALRDTVLCGHCGCFILFRARAAKSYCPHPAGDRWIDFDVYIRKNTTNS
jgi:hypothetical protein